MIAFTKGFESSRTKRPKGVRRWDPRSLVACVRYVLQIGRPVPISKTCCEDCNRFRRVCAEQWRLYCKQNGRPSKEDTHEALMLARVPTMLSAALIMCTKDQD